MVSRGIAAVGALQTYGFPDAWAKPKLVLRDERRRLLDMLDRKSRKAPTVPPADSPGIPGTPGSRAGPSRLEMRDIGVDRGLMGTLLEAIATGGAGFSVRAHYSFTVDGSDKEEDGGGLTMSALHGGGGGGGTGVGDASSAAISGTGGGRGSGPAVSVSQEVMSDRDRPRNQDRGAGEDSAVVGRAGVGAGILGPTAGQDGLGRPVAEVNTTKYRTPMIIDSFIMASVAADIEPTSLALSEGGSAAPSYHAPRRDDTKGGMRGAGTRAWGKDSEQDDARLVIGPEIEWGLGTGADADDVTRVGPVSGALKEAGEAGLSLPELRRSVGGIGVGGDGMGEDETEAKEESVLLAGLGCAIRSGAVVCVCGAEDIRWVCSAGAVVDCPHSWIPWVTGCITPGDEIFQPRFCRRLYCS